MAHWLATETSTKTTTGPRFKTKREAIEYGRRMFSGIFIVWKPKQFDKKDPRAIDKGPE